VKGQESGLIKVWFLGLVVAVLLVIGGVEANPGPQVEQGKIYQILSYVKKSGGRKQSNYADGGIT
jgi:hypothetical protein